MTPLLTFDDGPSEWTPAILDLLAERDETAIFFWLGQRVEERPALALRTHEEGHIVAVHGWAHLRLTDLVDSGVRGELADTAELIEELTGEKPGLWRAPFFAADERCNQIAMQLGLAYLGANLVPDDWAAQDAEELARKVLAVIRPQSVVCLHDGIPPGGGSESCTDSRQVTVDALRLILEGMAA